MQTVVWIAIVVAILIVVGLGLAVFVQRQRSRHLRDRFGPEYDRTVSSVGDQRQAEQELAAREQRRRQFEIRELDPQMRARYLEDWRRVQLRFVDSPVEALGEADALVTVVMRQRGYPMDGFEQAAADVSVDHPRAVEAYRAAHAISEASGRNETDTEGLRRGIQHYRALFDSLLGEEGTRDSEQPRAQDRHQEQEEQQEDEEAREHRR